MTPINGESLYGGAVHRRVTIVDLAAAKKRGEKWAMLTSYEAMTAEIFDEAGISVLLVQNELWSWQICPLVHTRPLLN
jgi:hypothetical protein